MIKRISIYFILLSTLLLSGMRLNAYEFSDSSYYIICTSKELGKITLYVPKNQISNISISKEGQIINDTSQNVILYCNDYQSYTFNIQPFDRIRYRVNYNDYNYLTILSIDDTNIHQLSPSFSFITNNYNVIVVSILFIGGIILWLIWLKH